MSIKSRAFLAPVTGWRKQMTKVNFLSAALIAAALFSTTHAMAARGTVAPRPPVHYDDPPSHNDPSKFGDGTALQKESCRDANSAVSPPADPCWTRFANSAQSAPTWH
jgi:hypothetical protein